MNTIHVVGTEDKISSYIRKYKAFFLSELLDIKMINSVPGVGLSQSYAVAHVYVNFDF